ncbi:hypothetical protein GCM10010112_77550 [Actinoplanes lobatus]|uniref:Uncharacterized protein n=1 Tax=Actinoplanes lobatus TaxID=113568 RepID=A0ABQ4AH60_9ACTN|nr:hypothetical protein GCM10010112_77550 [Actinoplanes lobatus]GIE40344.1 hypothetical protein Alo02nite_32420 [Actinoplanes lobatus]
MRRPPVAGWGRTTGRARAGRPELWGTGTAAAAPTVVPAALGRDAAALGGIGAVRAKTVRFLWGAFTPVRYGD